jgi:hypothetical protein
MQDYSVIKDLEQELQVTLDAAVVTRTEHVETLWGYEPGSANHTGRDVDYDVVVIRGASFMVDGCRVAVRLKQPLEYEPDDYQHTHKMVNDHLRAAFGPINFGDEVLAL